MRVYLQAYNALRISPAYSQTIQDPTLLEITETRVIQMSNTHASAVYMLG